MITLNVPIDEYIDKSFLIKEENLIVLPKRKEEHYVNDKCINLSMSLNETNESKDDILCALSDGFVNGYIESHKDIAKELLKLNYSYDDIKIITGLSINSIYKIENEL